MGHLLLSLTPPQPPRLTGPSFPSEDNPANSEAITGRGFEGDGDQCACSLHGSVSERCLWEGGQGQGVCVQLGRRSGSGCCPVRLHRTLGARSLGGKRPEFNFRALSRESVEAALPCSGEFGSTLRGGPHPLLLGASTPGSWPGPQLRKTGWWLGGWLLPAAAQQGCQTHSAPALRWERQAFGARQAVFGKNRKTNAEKAPH